MAVDAALLASLVQSYGYLLVFLLGVLEALPLIGIVVPGHATLLLAGVAAAAGLLDIRWVIAAALAAGIIGDAIGFWISRRYGKRFLDRYGAKLRIKPQHVAKSNAIFDKYGAFALVVVRFSFIARSLGPLLAGMSRMPWRTFWLFNVLGAAMWAFGNALGGYFFGISFLAVQGAVGRILAYTLLSVLGVFLLYRTLRKFAPSFTRGDFAIAMLAIGSGAFFGILADRVADKGLDNLLDRNAEAITQAFAPLAGLFRIVDLATGFAVLGVVALAMIAVLASKGRKWEAFLVAIGVGGVIAISTAMQPAFGSIVQSTGAAQFPSPHASIPLVLVGVATYLVWERTRSWARPTLAAALGILLVAAASVSRMAQGREYPSAVVAGIALGAAWFAVSLLLVEFAIKRRRPAPMP
jgi:undecaprenyl-diphosphatase